MIQKTDPVHIGNHVLDIVNLPEAAQQEFVTFYEFLLLKYQGQEPLVRTEKQRILSAIFQEADGKLPVNYTLNREELHERYDLC